MTWRVLTGGTSFNLDNRAQSYGFKGIEKFVNSGVRIIVRFDLQLDQSYPAQGRIHADVWMVGLGWTEGVSFYGSDPQVLEITDELKKPRLVMDPPGPTREQTLSRIIEELLRPAMEALLMG